MTTPIAHRGRCDSRKQQAAASKEVIVPERMPLTDPEKPDKMKLR
jgi:hypothetical protein